jgi:hypothetical protein
MYHYSFNKLTIFLNSTPYILFTNIITNSFCFVFTLSLHDLPLSHCLYLNLFFALFVLCYCYTSKVLFILFFACYFWINFGTMKLSKSILIVILFLLFSSCVCSNIIVRKSLIVRNLFDGAKKTKKTSDQTFNVHKCNTKRHKFGPYLSCYNKKNTNSDDKRLVPTGPNPLHNR